VAGAEQQSFARDIHDRRAPYTSLPTTPSRPRVTLRLNLSDNHDFDTDRIGDHPPLPVGRPSG
jgi:hypothetical protein